MSKSLEVAISAALIAFGLAMPAKAGDAAAGEKVFNKCKACHVVGEGAKHRVGPELNALFGRTAGTADGYKYSPAMQKAGAGGLVWNEETLGSYLADPKASVPGTKMAFAGIKDAADLANVIAYLGTFSKAADAAPATPKTDDKAAVEAPAATDKPAETAPPAAEPAKAAAEPAPAPAQASADAPAPSGAQVAGLHFGLGRAATETEVAAWDIDVRPDGLGLPEGHGTVAQGEKLFDENCASCHGDFGEAVDRWPVLAGGQGTLKDDRPVKTVGSYWPYLSTVYDYIRRAMPFGNARSMSDDDVYALTAYVLYLNDIVTETDFELSKSSFGSIEMPNSKEFIPDDRDQEPFYANKVDPCMKDCVEGKAKITMHAEVLDVTPQDAGGDDKKPSAGIE